MRKLFTTIYIIALCFGFSTASFGQYAQKAKSRHSSVGNKEQEAPKMPLPNSIELNDEVVNKGAVVTLAVNSTTNFHCPERPKQIIFGSGENTPIIINFPTPDLPEVYLIAAEPNIYTDMTIIMPSGSFHLYVKTVLVKGGAKPGDYHSMVLIKNDLYKEELSRVQAKIKESEQTVSKLNTKIAELVKTNNDARALNEQSQAELLKLLATSTAIQAKTNSQKPIRQVGKATRMANGWLVIFAVENRGKQALSLDAVNCASNKLVLPFDGAQNLAPNTETRIPVLIKDGEEEKAAKADASAGASTGAITLTFIVKGAATTLKVEA